MNYVLVFIGGGLGSICRFGIAQLLASQKLDFPYATLLANALACIVLGVLMGMQIKNGVTDMQKFVLMTGFCGGFSTFSTFTGETVQLFQTGQVGYAFFNILLSLLVCLICLYLGMKLVS